MLRIEALMDLIENDVTLYMCCCHSHVLILPYAKPFSEIVTMRIGGTVQCLWEGIEDTRHAEGPSCALLSQ